MKLEPNHAELLERIRQHSGTPTQHTFLDSYLGTTHTRYPINIPKLRSIAREWMNSHREMNSTEFKRVLTSLIHGASSTEKVMAGIMLALSRPAQQEFDPRIFDNWLEQLEGWAEVDALCTGNYCAKHIPANFAVWKKITVAFSRSKNIHKRRASIVLLCSPLGRSNDPRLVALALENIDRLKGEKEIRITKAISWVLRSAVKFHKTVIGKYVHSNKDRLPKIAVRETMVKITTGRKNKPKSQKS